MKNWIDWMSMKINSLEEMEKIVNNNKNLFWEGWNVCAYENEDGFYSKKGIYKDNKWLIKNSFLFKDNAWTIPDRYINGI